MKFEHTADEIVGWLEETEIENSKFIPNDVRGAESENFKSHSERRDGFRN